MRAVVITDYGPPGALQIAERATPKPAKGEALVRVRAVGVNRADVMQRRGLYPAPPDAPQDIPGLEFAGVVDDVGEGVTEVKHGDRVYGLAGGGTYAEYVVVPARTLAPIPSNLTFVQAAGVPEAFITAYDAMVTQAKLAAGEYVLISAVGSGVGTAAVQITRAIGAFSVGTARSSSKLESAHRLGMNHAVLAQDATFADKVLECTGGNGANVVLELVGGRYVAEDLKCVSVKGRIMVVGLVAGARCEADLAAVLSKRINIRGTTLRRRPLEEKIMAGQQLAHNLSPLFASGQLKPIIDKVFPLEDAPEAHAYMEANDNFGKIILEVEK